MHAPNQAGQKFEAFIDRHLVNQGFRGAQGQRRLQRNVRLPVVGLGAAGKGVIDFSLWAAPGAYAPELFPGHDTSQPVHLALEVRAQKVTGTADEKKFIHMFLKMASLPPVFSHKLVVTDVDSVVSTKTRAMMNAIYHGEGVRYQWPFEEVVLRATPQRNRWADVAVFLPWRRQAFPNPGQKRSSATPPVFMAA